MPAIFALLLSLLTVAVVAVSSSPARADTYLCSNNSRSVCTGAGYTDHGYSSHTGTSYWGAYLGTDGHNCTNYVAYAEQTVNGAPAPSYLLGNGSDWANNASAHGVAVNTTPGRGSVAQWNANSMHPAGHVAYVESVNSDGSITVSEDVYSTGPFSWETIVPGDANWPNHFIHFKDLPPAGSWGGIGSGPAFLGADTLSSGQQMSANQYIESADARFALLLQSDGNLVLYGGSAIWSSGTGGSGATRLVMQTDGNLVLYNVNTPVWFTATGGTGAAHLSLQTDGNLVTYNNSSGSPTWWTGTGGHAATTDYGSDTLSAAQQLNPQQYLRSSDKRYGLLLQSDGNLVVYGPGYHVLWSSGTGGSGATRLVMQTDGNLVLYNANTPVWFTATGGTGAAHLSLQTDGNLVVYNDASSAVEWQSGTSGQI
jgi:surface antigen